MKFFCEMIVLFDDIKMPDEKQFMPSLWECDDIDSDGDYYWDNMNSCWTHLSLSKNDKNTEFKLNIFREKREFDPSIVEVADLSRYIDYKLEGRYDLFKNIHNAANLCVASFVIETIDSNVYLEYLKTIYEFLKYTNGITANYYDFNAEGFCERLM